MSSANTNTRLFGASDGTMKGVTVKKMLKSKKSLKTTPTIEVAPDATTGDVPDRSASVFGHTIPEGKPATVSNKPIHFEITWRWRWDKDFKSTNYYDGTTVERAINKLYKDLTTEYDVSKADVLVLNCTAL